MLTSNDFTFTGLDSSSIANLSNPGFDRILKKTHDELIVTKEMYEKLTNEIPIGVWRADRTGIIQYENKTLINLINKSLLHQHISNILPCTDEKKLFLYEWSTFMSNSDIMSLNYEFSDPTISRNSDKWFKLKINQLSNDEYMGVVSDITVEKSTIPKLLMLKAEMKNISKTF